MTEVKRYTILIISSLILSLNFNILILPNTMVIGGISGLGVIMQDFFNPGLFMFLINIILIILSGIILGFKKTKDFVIGALLFPFFVFITEDIAASYALVEVDLLLLVIVAAAVGGAAIGIIIKNGFSTGGVDIAACILSKLTNRSIGNSVLMIDGLIVLLGAFRFGIVKAMYAVIFIYILSTVIDRIILGISSNKAFYIVTNEEARVKSFILNEIGHGASILRAKGGYYYDQKNIIFCVIPSNEYFRLKEGINNIDPDAFFMVTDAYEVHGGA